ncbi:hypothetical protein [Halarcobacter sp.]|uniref:hypothetical protein n=1 Tax=Halarcobacter sp. TaxID=2321133 RepID=UPI002AAB785F|nr:hypothetical protein [Halarcobacter sp.]
MDNNLRLNTLYLISKEDYDFLNTIQLNKLIPDSHKTLQEKFKYILKYNHYLVTTSNKRILSYDEYKDKNKREEFLEINSSDITNIKKYIIDYNKSNKQIIPYFLDKEKCFKKEIILSLSDLCLHFGRYDRKTFINETDELLSVKIYDYYQDSKNKDKYLYLLENIINDNFKFVKECQIVSIVNSLKTHEFLTKQINEKKERIKIKLAKNINGSSYIPSVFFMLLKYRIKNTSKYRNYILYLEPITNHSVIGFVQDDFSKGFYRLLLNRFDKHFSDKANIDFIENLKQQDFDASLNDIFNSMKLLLESNNKDLSVLQNNIINKVLELKIQYPKMSYSYKLLDNIVNSICIAKEIEYAQANDKQLINTINIIKHIFEYKIYNKTKKILLDVVNKDTLDDNIDIFRLRKSIYVNKIGKSKKALIDIFPTLKWGTKNEILSSLEEIRLDSSKLNELLKLMDYDCSKMNLSDKQNFYQKTILEDFIYSGRVIKLN